MHDEVHEHVLRGLLMVNEQHTDDDVVDVLIVQRVGIMDVPLIIDEVDDEYTQMQHQVSNDEIDISECLLYHIQVAADII